MNNVALYSSKCTFKSFWNSYHIFADKLVLESIIGKITIPFENIESVSVEESDVKGLLKGDLKLKNFRPAIKLDWANMTEHIVIDKSDGMLHRVLFTPDNIPEFMHELEKARKANL